MQKTVCLLTSWLLVGAAAGQDVDYGKEVTANLDTQPAAIDILVKVDAAAKAVKSVRYRGSFRGTGWLEDRVSQVMGKATIGGWYTNTIGVRRFERFRFDVEVRDPGSEEVRKLVAGNVGDQSYLIDWRNEIVHAAGAYDVIGSDGRTAQAIGMVEFVHPTPFSDEINADRAEMRGTAAVGGEKCHVVYVDYARGREEATWYFSQNDYLPRRVDRMYRDGDALATTELIVTDLVVDPEIDDDDLALTVPEGFETTEEFARDRTRRGPRRIPLFEY